MTRHRLRGLVGGVEKSFDLAPGDNRVGSSRSADVVLPVRGVSRQHAVVTVGDAGLTVVDEASRNGTYVDEHRVERAAVADGDELRFGSVRLRLEAVEEDDEELAIAFSLPEAATASPARSALEETTQYLSVPHSSPGLVFPDGYRPLRSPPMAALYRQLRRLTRGTLPVLIVGETGVGKEQLARALHLSSERRHKPYLAINCAALPAELLEAELFGIEKGVATGVEKRPGKFRLADSGTLFLDEVTEMAPPLQAKLLRALQEKEIQPLGGAPEKVDVRIVAATNAGLHQRMDDGLFRRDLYYRLAGCVLEVPSLRQCRDDVAALVEHFLTVFVGETGVRLRGVTVRALELLAAHDWPGNVRELEHEVRRLVYQADDGQVIDAGVLSKEVRRKASVEVPPAVPLEPLALEPRLREIETCLVREALRQAQGNQSEAARLLEITRNGLAKKLKRLGIDPQDFTERPRSS